MARKSEEAGCRLPKAVEFLADLSEEEAAVHSPVVLLKRNEGGQVPVATRTPPTARAGQSLDALLATGRKNFEELLPKLAAELLRSSPDLGMAATAFRDGLLGSGAAALGALMEAVDREVPTEWAEQELAKHGRLETREIWVSTEPLHTVTLPRAEYIFAIRQTVRLYRCAKPGRREVVGITSHAAATADAARLLSLNRLHWTIENRVHRVLDEPTRPSQKRLSNFRSGGSGAAPAARSFGGFGGGSRIEAIVQRD